MKKKFLVLSAMLTLVVSGVCLQSCSSEFDSYTTEEYGYYTEEEINAIEALAEQYDIIIEINEGYWGVKRTLDDIEQEFRSVAALAGEYEFFQEKGVLKTRKKGTTVVRTMTRSSEGSHSFHNDEGDYRITVDISWQTSDSDYQSGTATGSASIEKRMEPGILGTSTLSCSMSGKSTIIINFSGVIGFREKKTEQKEETEETEEETFINYKCTISQGTLNIQNNTGSFICYINEQFS